MQEHRIAKSELWDECTDLRDSLYSRILEMERYFDIVQNALRKDKTMILSNWEIKEMVYALKNYQESGQWLKDFEYDERGEIPLEFQRGVLSEDGLYNFLIEVEEILSTKE
jgi:hypothetical protein